MTKNEGGTDAGEYDVVLTLKDAKNHKWADSEEAAKTLKFQIAKAEAPAVATPALGAVTYDLAKTLADVALPEGWAWANREIVPTVTNAGYEASLTVDDKNYDSCYLPPLRWAIAFEGSAVRSEISETVRVCEHAGASGKMEVPRRAATRALTASPQR